MLLGGLWHGASWHFVIWGGFHGLGLVAHRLWEKSSERIALISRIRSTSVWSIFAWLLTMLAVVIGWTIFRADDLPTAMAVYAAMFSLKTGAQFAGSVTEELMQSVIPAALTIYATAYLTIKNFRRMAESDESPASSQWQSARFWLSPPLSARLITYAGIALLTMGFASLKSIPFIYFQF